MANLHMNVESCRSTRSSIQSTHDTLNNEATQMKGRVDAMTGGDWIAPSANQFKNEFENWHSRANSLLQELEQLGQKLDREITEWENTASTL
jgi:WXG100 family type VII secretion target